MTVYTEISFHKANEAQKNLRLAFLPNLNQLQQQQKTTIIARMIIQVQLSSKIWHKQLLFIMFASGS